MKTNFKNTQSLPRVVTISMAFGVLIGLLISKCHGTTTTEKDLFSLNTTGQDLQKIEDDNLLHEFALRLDEKIEGLEHDLNVCTNSLEKLTKKKPKKETSARSLIASQPMPPACLKPSELTELKDKSPNGTQASYESKIIISGLTYLSAGQALGGHGLNRSDSASRQSSSRDLATVDFLRVGHEISTSVSGGQDSTVTPASIIDLNFVKASSTDNTRIADSYEATGSFLKAVPLIPATTSYLGLGLTVGHDFYHRDEDEAKALSVYAMPKILIRHDVSIVSLKADVGLISGPLTDNSITQEENAELSLHVINTPHFKFNLGLAARRHDVYYKQIYKDNITQNLFFLETEF
jgi:hypothetical protein